jgi:hypothetical protein
MFPQPLAPAPSGTDGRTDNRIERRADRSPDRRAAELLAEAEAQRALAELFPHLKLDALRAIQDLFPLARRRVEVRPASNAVH